MMARLSPAGGALFAMQKLQQSYSVSRNIPLYFELADPVKGMALVATSSLSAVQIDNQTAPFGPGGEYHRWFNRAWIPSFYEDWDGHYKARVAPLLGKAKPADVKIGYFGDLRLLRNDVIHHKGQVIDAVREKCVVFKWFGDGEEIVLAHTHYAQLFTEFPWAKLGAVEPAPPAPAPVDRRLPATPLEAVLYMRNRAGGHFFG